MSDDAAVQHLTDLMMVLMADVAAIKVKVTSIEAQCIKTNGRVFKLEDRAAALELKEAVHSATEAAESTTNKSWVENLKPVFFAMISGALGMLLYLALTNASNLIKLLEK